MQTPFKRYILLGLLLVGGLTACTHKGEDVIPTTSTSSTNIKVNNWIYEQMKLYYYWTAKIPAYSTTDSTLSPSDYFYSLLNTYNATSNTDGDRFSWIATNADSLTAALNGESVTTGMQFRLFYRDNNQVNVIGQVLYVAKGSPAQTAGFARGDVFTKVNNQALTVSNYNGLLFGGGSTAYTLGTVDATSGTITDSQVTKTVTPATFQEDPVYLDSVYTVNGKKVGYLVYNEFVEGPNGSTIASYDQHIEQIFGEFKAAGIQELILDLRYNPGGSSVSATNLASLIGKGVSSSQVFFKQEYNTDLTAYLTQQYGADSFNEYFTTESNSIGNQLSRVYVLTSDWTASASELMINGLKPYMTVTLIGETTYGKNVGSTTITDETGVIKYGLQPIIVKAFNSQGQSNYTGGFQPDTEVSETISLLPLGNPQETLLSTALQAISSNGRLAANNRTQTPLRTIGASMTHKATFGRLVLPATKFAKVSKEANSQLRQ